MNRAPRDRDILVGTAFMVLGVSLLPAMSTLSKLLAAEFPVWQMVWARFLGHLLCVTLVFWPRRGLALFRTSHWRPELARSLIFFLSNIWFITALRYVSLPTATSLMFTTPLVVVALSVPILGERVGWLGWGAVLVGFGGALVIIRPGTAVFDVWALLVLGAAGCFGCYQIITRQLATHEPADTLIVYTALAGAASTTAFFPLFGVAPTSLGQVLAFAGVGIIGAAGQFCVIQALRRGPASVMSPIGYAELVSSVGFGYVVFGDLPDRWTWYGGGLIITSGLFIAYRESLHPQRDPRRVQ